MGLTDAAKRLCSRRHEAMELRSMDRILAAATLLALSAALAGLPVANATDLSGGGLNLAPTITSVTLSTTSATPTAGTPTSLTATIVAADGNGYSDIPSNGVQVTILNPDGSTKTAASAASFVSGSALSATFTKTFTMNYYDAAATGATKYKVKVVVTDSAAAAV